ncbi:YlbF family regulator [Paludicola sp. MB14-C6]|uniref:YlbF family regulator n=1 Tax=Paludihabitans sp. MB14-C6 TaxID=3070656 RepID=UPI0027DC151E|nr:YlbF family regulator [Paludicola sp. MB14-C6]WMJ23104.1 YlbF family regulator [Paludicola sp. MB14-C6]
MDIIKMARDLGKAIQESPEYKRINAAKAANDADVELQNLIEVFNMTRVKLSTAMQAEEKDEQLLAKLDKELKETYTTVMGNKNMLEFNDAKQDIDKLMNQINTILVAAVNGEDPETCEAESHSCGGSCSSCSGCH